MVLRTDVPPEFKAASAAGDRDMAGGGPRRAAEALISAAREHGADLIVTGARRHGAVASAMLGSVCDHLVHHSDTPVLVVPGPG